MNTSDQSSEQRIIARAARDEAYRKRLIADTKRAITEETGTEVPMNIEVKVVQESPTTLYLVLPHLEQAREGELSDVELQNVAGGAAAGGLSWFRVCPCKCLSAGTRQTKGC